MKEEEEFWERKLPKELILHSKDDGIIYKYTSLETAIKIIESNSLYYSSPNVFNDPFDLSIEFLETKFNEKQIRDVLEGWNVDKELKEKAINHYINNPNELSLIMRDTFEKQKNESGITCFSKSPLKALMWSHYADKHKGICLGFSFKNEEEKFIQAPIDYAHEIKKINYAEDTRLGVYKWLFTKSHVWDYEEEIRRVSNIGNGLIPFRTNELKEIYFGLKLDKNQVKKINQILSEHLFKLDKISVIEMNKKTFDLKETEID
jgi:hypothetical protein